MSKPIGVTVAVLLLSLGGTPVLRSQFVPKWEQPPAPAVPTNVFYGWNEMSMFQGPQIAADDFVCTSFSPVTTIRWWGSWRHWRSNAPPPEAVGKYFHLAIWTDVPAGPGGTEPFSHPGTVMWNLVCTNYTTRFVGWDYDPRMNSYEACFEFEQTLYPQEYFYQPGPTNILWLSIAAMPWPEGPLGPPWGWKTRPRDPASPAPDDAVRIFRPTEPWLGASYQAGEPIFWPEPANSWDLAFELISQAPKWEQRPDLTPLGIDVNASLWITSTLPPLTNGYLLADDFPCMETGPLTDISIWGSWWHNRLGAYPPTNVTFTLSIHTNLPTLPSKPGTVLWWRSFPPGSYSVTEVSTGVMEGWLDPTNRYEPNADSRVFRYDFHVDPTAAFVQRGSLAAPALYWLDVQARPGGRTNEFAFGWKTSLDQWNDTSVFVTNKVEPYNGGWIAMYYPAGHQYVGRPMDLAFQVAGPPEIKWSQPPTPYTPPDAFNGWNQQSVYGQGPIVADDWVCTTRDPVSDIHWWGSFIGWGEPSPPPLPDAFLISIWTDVPRQGAEFSHPGTCVWTVECRNFTFAFAGWDFDPRNPGAPPEACYVFDQQLDPAEWFFQEPLMGTNVYWVSIAAQYFTGVPPSLWGWKTRPRNPASPAPDDAVAMWPDAPQVGAVWQQGYPLEYPPGTSWDTAFVLTTQPTEPRLDFGDAPDSLTALGYPTLLINNGARHTIVPGVFLGTAIDGEPDGQPNANATGDDNNPVGGPDDEDGVFFVSPLIPGQSALIQVQASVPGFLNAWVDFNADTDWIDPGEWIFLNQPLAAGWTPLNFTVPASAAAGRTTFARFRFCTTNAWAVACTNAAPDGEVEDYQVWVDYPPPKWVQWPDISTMGLDVMDTYSWNQIILADDFQCATPGQITNIIVWGSWFDEFGAGCDPSATFSVAIWSDVPAVTNGPVILPSHPGELLWYDLIGPVRGELVARPQEMFYAPDQGIIGPDDNLYRYTLRPTMRPFMQLGTSNNPVTYWLSVTVVPVGSDWCFYGWKTSTNHWNDDAVWGHAVADPERPYYDVRDWRELRDPRTGQSLDLAFAILSSVVTNLPQADLGDAPDSTGTYGNIPMTAYPKGGPIFPGGVPANFPTVYQGGIYPAGPIHWQPTNVAFLGQGVSRENEADTGLDEDFSNNLIPLSDLPDLDRWDDGVLNVQGLMLAHCETNNTFRFQVTVRNPSPALFYLNAWFDWNRDGDWNDVLACSLANDTPEWAVQNQTVSVAAAGTVTLTTPPFRAWHPPLGPGDQKPPLWLRVTLSEQRWPPVGLSAPAGGMGPTNGYQFGETEDYYVTNYLDLAWDFGDAPDAIGALGYPTLLAHNGARHIIVPGVFLGHLVDPEPDGQPNANATGDDFSPPGNPDDEDGIVFASALVPGQPVQVTVTASAAGYLNAWVDFNANSTWADAGEQIILNQPLGPGTTTFAFTVPGNAAAGVTTFARFRFSTSTNWPIAETGPAPDGEVEDYQVRIDFPESDLGDAPDSSNSWGLPMNAYPGVPATFPTVYQAGSPPYGPKHLTPTAVAWLGQAVSAEAEADTGWDADGVNNISVLLPPPILLVPDQDRADDGVVFPLALPHCARTTFPYLVNVAGPVGPPLYVNVWLDWNRDGDWADTPQCPGGPPAPEWAVQNQLIVPPGPGLMTMLTPPFVAWHPRPERSEPLWMRITLSEQMLPPGSAGEGPAAAYQIGETEDYSLTDYLYMDFGDAPQPYPTMLAQNGARHVVVNNIYLGASVDVEADGQPNDGLDEDGVVFLNPLRPGQTASIQVTASTAGLLYAWVDFNADGDWADAGEQLWAGLPLTPGTQTLTFLVPWNATATAATWARFRFTTVAAVGLSYTGLASDGEVEDYPVEIQEPELDFGDAPDTPTFVGYPTLLIKNGARHIIVPGVCLGATVDAEADGQPNATASGDDLAGVDDEDGVTLYPLMPGTLGTVKVVASAPGVLYAWVDFNADGDWADAGEQILAAQPLNAGPNTLTFPVSAAAVTGTTTFARFRFTTVAGVALSPTGLAPDGEVEDYPVVITPVKYQQPPDLSPNGLDVLATADTLLADDFLCREKGPITDIHVWGSWLRDQVDTHAAFWLGLWTDVPRTNAAYPSHPGTLLWSQWFLPGEYLASVFARADELFFDPNRTNILGPDTQVWQYDFFPQTPFLQEGMPNTNRTYWLSVMAVTRTNTVFGWKTSTEHWQDAAVYGHLETNWAPRGDWRDIHWPPGGPNLDLAFAITTRRDIPECVDPPKVITQRPDTTANALDVLATAPKILADDFVCANPGGITNIVVWGGWANDVADPAAPFLLGLWRDVPATATNVSHPGQLIVQWWFGPNDYQFSTSLVTERFYDPNRELNPIIATNARLWRYEFRPTYLTQALWQLGRERAPRVYWLSVCVATTNGLFGWKTSPEHNLAPDAAVFGHLGPFYMPSNDWRALHYPGAPNQRMDLAFEVRTDTRAPTLFSITPTVWNNSVTLTWAACPGQIYRVQYRNQVQGPGWSDLPGDVMAWGDAASKSDFMILPYRFYRVVRLP